MKLKIREYKARDMPSIIECICLLQEEMRAIEPNRVNGQTIAKRYVQNMIKKLGGSRQIFVAQLDGKTVGFIEIVIEKELHQYIYRNPTHGIISNLIVLPKYRKMAIGRKLISAAEKFVAKKDVKNIYIEVYGDNKEAINFYHNMGYQNYEITLKKRL